MVRTESTMLPLGSKAPDFDLATAGGRRVTRDDYAGKPLLVIFLCNHCPFVHHVAETLAALSAEYAAKGVAVVGINSNINPDYPDDAPEKMPAQAATWGVDFPYLVDADQAVARAYRAACTPDFFLFNAEHHLVYRGQMDGSRPGNDVPNDGADLRAALEAVLGHGAYPDPQRPSMGCNIKWRPGNEPDYFGRA